MKEFSFGDLVGRTPLLDITTLLGVTRHRILAKCEFANPNGSIKDRIAERMIDVAETNGQLIRGKSTIVEATAGNTGLALAAVGVKRGYKVKATLSSKMSAEKISTLIAAGVEVVVCEYNLPSDHPDTFINTARRFGDLEHHWFSDQFSNPANPISHRNGTAREIFDGVSDGVDAIIAGFGTGGTVIGCSTYAREVSPGTKVVIADPVGSVLSQTILGQRIASSPYKIEGIGGDFLPPLFNPDLIDDALQVRDDDSFEMCRFIYSKSGILIGGSSGCALTAAKEYADRLGGNGKTIVAILPDTGRNYASTIFARGRAAISA